MMTPMAAKALIPAVPTNLQLLQPAEAQAADQAQAPVVPLVPELIFAEAAHKFRTDHQRKGERNIEP